ncbi:MAG: hypothetical protein HQL73_05330 [Magnetococcales bacterium]|nr:hypothetical protein [Magnetococcales bacterium]
MVLEYLNGARTAWGMVEYTITMAACRMLKMDYIFAMNYNNFCIVVDKKPGFGMILTGWRASSDSRPDAPGNFSAIDRQ